MAPWLGWGAISVSGEVQTAGCRSGRLGGMLATEANRTDSRASHTTGKTDGSTANTHANLLRFPGKLGRREGILPIGERYIGRARTSPRRKASQQAGGAGRHAYLAARQEACP